MLLRHRLFLPVPSRAAVADDLHDTGRVWEREIDSERGSHGHRILVEVSAGVDGQRDIGALDDQHLEPRQRPYRRLGDDGVGQRPQRYSLYDFPHRGIRVDREEWLEGCTAGAGELTQLG